MPPADPHRVPQRLRGRFQLIVALTDLVAAEHLDAEYAELCRRMTAVLARRRPSPLERGEPRTWAAGILHAVGWVNFLTDPSRQPHMTTAALAAATGVGQSTIAATFRKIRDTLDLGRMDPEWTRPSELLDNPFVWIVLVNGLPMDLRDAPPEIQEAAFRQGVIPFIPEPADIVTDGDTRGPVAPVPSSGTHPAVRSATSEMEDALQQALAGNPDATIEELNAALHSASDEYNHRAQSELGGLSPAAVQRLLEADWEGPESVIRLDDGVALQDLIASRTLHDARVILAMLAERGEVKATSKGNLPREFVEAFRARMRPLPRLRDDDTTPRMLNEEDFLPLHLPRILLEISGLVQRRKGCISRTRRGEALTADARAGALFATLVRVHFRRFNLAYLDGAADAPDFQSTIGYSLYRFSRWGDEWRTAEDSSDLLVLPGVRLTMPSSPHLDMVALIVRTRFLGPLAGFALAEERHLDAGPDDFLGEWAYRKTPLFGRVVSFRLTSDARGEATSLA